MVYAVPSKMSRRAINSVILLALLAAALPAAERPNLVIVFADGIFDRQDRVARQPAQQHLDPVKNKPKYDDHAKVDRQQFPPGEVNC